MNSDTRRIGKPAQRGFTLLELMIVVVITGILAAIAIPTFTGYVYKSRTSEATQFLGQIKLRQEEYRSEFGRYAQINGANTAFVPGDFRPGTAAVMRASQSQTFPGTTDQVATDWDQLGADPGGPVMFGYGIMAAMPGTTPAPNPWNLPNDHYFVAQAVSDLDGDGDAITFEINSHAKRVWYGPCDGTDTWGCKGWE